MYKPVAVTHKNGIKGTLSTPDMVIGFKTAYSYFHVWKSDGYDILEAYIELYNMENPIDIKKIDTLKVDISKLV